MRVDRICRDYELEISKILLKVDPRDLGRHSLEKPGVRV